MRLRRLKLDVQSTGGAFGATLQFQTGLNLLRADNTSGKSTCMQAVFYALGLEAMFGPSRTVPLPHAMTDSINEAGVNHAVLESSVTLEFENRRSEVMTVRRHVVHEGIDSNLVNVWRGPQLSEPGSSQSSDYYVRLPGAAVRDRGFHHLLAEFLGWQLPVVSRFDGADCPLYLECLAPWFFVEQKHGWSTIHAQVPTHYRIREVEKRTFEFVTNLDAYMIAKERARIADDRRALELRWTSMLSDIREDAEKIGGVVSGFEAVPVAQWDPLKTLQILVESEQGAVSVSKLLSDARERLAGLSTYMPTSGDDADAVGRSLLALERRVSDLELRARIVLSSLEEVRLEIVATEAQVSVLEEDLVRHQDLIRLRTLGSVAENKLESDRCPTCGQAVNGVLVETHSNFKPMTADENVDFIRAQLETFRAMRNDLVQTLVSKERVQAATKDRLERARAALRSARNTLVSPDKSASESAIRERLTLEADVARYVDTEEAVADSGRKFRGLMGQWTKLLAAVKALPPGDLSTGDRAKLLRIQSLLQGMLQEFGFSSLASGSISISDATYRPSHEGYDLGFDLSASDMIRVIWGYMLAALELARELGTNHPGLLMFDEPRQQDADPKSFAAFLRRASLSKAHGQQVIVATSEKADSLFQMVSGVEHHVIAFEGRILSRLA